MAANGKVSCNSHAIDRSFENFWQELLIFMSQIAGEGFQGLCQSTGCFFPGPWKRTFFLSRLTNEITDEINQSDKSLLCWLRDLYVALTYSATSRTRALGRRLSKKVPCFEAECQLTLSNTIQYLKVTILNYLNSSNCVSIWLIYFTFEQASLNLFKFKNRSEIEKLIREARSKPERNVFDSVCRNLDGSRCKNSRPCIICQFTSGVNFINLFQV